METLIERGNFHLVKENIKTLIEDAQIADDSIKRYDAYLRHLLHWAWDTPFTQAVTIRPTLLAYLEQTPSKRSGTLAPQSRKKIVECARKFFEWAKMNHPAEFKALPPAWIQKLKFLKRQANQAKNKLEFMELDEVIALATTPGAEGDLAHWRDRAMAARLFLTGERANAAVTSPISAIDFKDRTLKQWPELGVRTKNSKGATTYLLLIPELLEVARSWDEYVRKNLPPTAVWYAPIDSKWGEQKLSEQKPGKNRSVG